MSKNGFLKHADFFLLDALSLLLAYYLSGYFKSIGNFLDDRTYRTLIVFEFLTFVAVVYFYAPYKSILRKKFTNVLLNTVAFGVLQCVMVVFLLFVAKFGSNVSRLFLGFQYVFFVCISFKTERFKTASDIFPERIFDNNLTN